MWESVSHQLMKVWDTETLTLIFIIVCEHGTCKDAARTRPGRTVTFAEAGFWYFTGTPLHAKRHYKKHTCSWSASWEKLFSVSFLSFIRVAGFTAAGVLLKCVCVHRLCPCSHTLRCLHVIWLSFAAQRPRPATTPTQHGIQASAKTQQHTNQTHNKSMQQVCRVIHV